MKALELIPGLFAFTLTHLPITQYHQTIYRYGKQRKSKELLANMTEAAAFEDYHPDGIHQVCCRVYKGYFLSPHRHTLNWGKQST